MTEQYFKPHAPRVFLHLGGMSVQRLALGLALFESTAAIRTGLVDALMRLTVASTAAAYPALSSLQQLIIRSSGTSKS